ncbi:glycosyltransferase family 4 protein [Trinickia dinghuensis]|uniref:Glycosyltransferase family 1 protein n=1 Tax=Trinickia dinghuensis TaxID=2291023 RepID=A0A3D8JWZ3_9BURK|nr:glycosyltransferase family 1 protein [Trinickia dinghuensis]RDU97322.1 glycosyltransferase family 1 protein [Trinickia dinghuensis]
MHLVVNGKFTAQRLTGVQRVAYELMRAVRSTQRAVDEIEVAVPKNGVASASPIDRLRQVPWLKGDLWEQIALPLATRGELLLSLCNSGPVFKRRHVVMVHDMAVYDTPHTFSWTFRTWYRVKFAMLMRNAPILLTVSAFSKARICVLLGVDESRVRVVRPGADHFGRIVSEPAIVERLGLAGVKYCVIVGSLDPRKNLARVLAAVERLGHLRDVKFVVVGGANSRVFAQSGGADTEGEGASGTQRPNVQLVRAGYVSDGELKALYEHAACLAFPSLYEGFGLPPLEAMYCGCPAIVSRHAALAEACGDAAMYCDADSVEDIARKIETMLTDDTLRASYREMGLRHAHAHGWDRAASELMKILRGETYEVEPAIAVQSAA